MSPDHRTSRRRRYLTLAAFMILALGPGAWAVGGVIGAGLLVVAVGVVAAARRVRHARREAGREARGDAGGARGDAGRGDAGRGDGVMWLGLDPAGRPVRITDRQLAAHALIVGASG